MNPVQTPGNPVHPVSSLYARTKITRHGLTLFKRYPAPNDHYYIRFSAGGRRVLRKLTRLADDSFRLARQFQAAAAAGRFDAIAATSQRAPALATYPHLQTCYLTSAVDANARTRRHNINALTLILRELGHANPAAITAAQIDGAACRRWYAQKTAALSLLTDQAAQATLKRGANSAMAQARSLFVPKALAAYKDAGLWHQTLEDFAAAYATAKFGRIPAADYNPPGDAIIAATLEAWPKLDRELFLAVGHELAFGLRKGELAQAQWGWWTVRQGYPVLDGQARVKNGTGLVQVRALDPFFSAMAARAQAEGWRGAAGDFIVSGNWTARSDGIFRAVSAWLRQIGWETRKTNHALRAYAGSQIAMKYGIYEAQSWLRHSSVRVTEGHYSHFVKRFRPSDPDALPVKWALLQSAPELRIFIPAKVA